MDAGHGVAQHRNALVAERGLDGAPHVDRADAAPAVRCRRRGCGRAARDDRRGPAAAAAPGAARRCASGAGSRNIGSAARRRRVRLSTSAGRLTVRSAATGSATMNQTSPGRSSTLKRTRARGDRRRGPESLRPRRDGRHGRRGAVPGRPAPASSITGGCASSPRRSQVPAKAAGEATSARPQRDDARAAAAGRRGRRRRRRRGPAVGGEPPDSGPCPPVVEDGVEPLLLLARLAEHRAEPRAKPVAIAQVGPARSERQEELRRVDGFRRADRKARGPERLDEIRDARPRPSAGRPGRSRSCRARAEAPRGTRAACGGRPCASRPTKPSCARGRLLRERRVRRRRCARSAAVQSISSEVPGRYWSSSWCCSRKFQKRSSSCR